MFKKSSLFLWIVVFSSVCALIATLATSWNFNWIELKNRWDLPAFWATVGFGAVMLGVFLMFFKLLHEMRLNHFKSDLLSLISHELKTPLATMELSSGMLSRPGLDTADTARLWQVFHRDFSRLKKEVDLLLNSAKIEHGLLKPRWQKMALGPWLEEKIRLLNSLLPAPVTLMAEKKNVNVRTDPEMLGRILDILVDNAVKFSGESPQIKVILSVAPKHFIIEINDQGPGFDPKFSKKIFRRFFRAGGYAQNVRHSGTGLGLYLANQSAKRLRLKLSAQSKGPQAGGTSFFIRGKVR